ncbi:MAG: C40 family peptidase [Bacteroidales bacterium]|nr:C40 family peptidase [Bacteroidales bacterium]
MVSQLLFGETFTADVHTDEWLHVQLDADAYEGWISLKQGTPLDATTHAQLQKWSHRLSAPVSNILVDNFPILLPCGARLPEKACRVANHTIDPAQAPVEPLDPCRAAKQLIGAPYLWGGRTALGIDCSGLVQTAFSLSGILLPRDAYQQADCGHPIDDLQHVQPADLAFFANLSGRIIHVGICLSPSLIVHASGQVHTDQLDACGIFHTTHHTYTHRLHSLRRIIE